MKILLGIDGSRYALAATRFVCEFLAQPWRQVDLLQVLPLVVHEGAAAPRREPESLHVPPFSRSWLDRAEKRLHSRGFRVTRRVRRGVPARVFPEMAAKGSYDLIVLGAKGRADNPYLPTGSVALAMLENHVPADIVLVRERLHGLAWGERHQPAVEVKGATYTALRVACEGGNWLAQTVVDV